jgi:hypothetical protein
MSVFSHVMAVIVALRAGMIREGETMSILQKALKKAETERAAQRRAESDANTVAPTPKRVSARTFPRRKWIALTLAIVSALGVGYGLRSMQPTRVPLSLAPQPMVEAPALRATHGLNAGDPLSLRLDRDVESLGARAR